MRRSIRSPMRLTGMRPGFSLDLVPRVLLSLTSFDRLDSLAVFDNGLIGKVDVLRPGGGSIVARVTINGSAGYVVGDKSRVGAP